MAILQPQPQNPNLQIYHLPQSQYIDAVRWLPPFSPFDKFLLLSLFNSSSSSSSLSLLSLNPNPNPNPNPNLTTLCSIPIPSRTSSLVTSQTLIAFSTYKGALNFLAPKYQNGDVLLDEVIEVRELGFHVGGISGIDLLGSECVSVGEDGRVNLLDLGGSKVDYTRVFDGEGLVAYNAVKWASPTEFVTGGFGFGMQWWDLRRKNGQPALKFKGHWPQKASGGLIHSIDIHPSRKHTCLAGGSSGTVFAWDLRWPQQPIALSGVGDGERQARLISESDVWEVQFDTHSQSNITSMSSSRLLPVMMCSEDGILSVVEQGAEPVELLAEPCAINGFDIGKQNHSDIICSLEWESLAIISRS